MTSTDSRREVPSLGRARRRAPGPATGLPVELPVALPEIDVRGRAWQSQYVRRLAVTDTVVIVAAVATAQLIRFGGDDAGVPGGAAVGSASAVASYTAVSLVLAGLWSLFLVLFRSRDRRTLGEGTDEYRRILDASLRLFGVVAIISLLFDVDLARGYLAIAFPLGVVGLAAGRKAWRTWLLRRRLEGGHGARVLVVGGRTAAQSMAQQFHRNPGAGYNVVGACVPGFTGGRGELLVVDDHRIPVFGDDSNVLAALQFCGADTVAVTATEHLGHDRMRELAWELEAVDVDLVVSPGMVDVAGPRLKIRPVAGLPLVHVEEPQYEGASRFGKWAFDKAVSLVVLVVASPVLLVAAVAVRATSRGPVFYRSERVGLNGEAFPMLKLRSMVEGAETMVIELAGANEAAGPLFKIRGDPRVTPVGRFMRKFSIDELPQLLNVLRGEMSIVGPRPPLRREVETYTGEVHRRLLVKPGITGLWQVSGRSDLSWDESVRLDLSYVENWSMIQDVVIVWRTLRAVLSSHGAY